MTKILVRSAYETYKADGFKILAEQTLRYINIYGNPKNLARYWIAKTKGQYKQIVNIQGSLMELDLHDKGIHSDLFINGIREPQATKYLQSILQPDWVVVEAGSNIGYYALMEAKVCKSVIAIEAGKDNYNSFLKNIRLNGYNNIQAFHLAAGDKNCYTSFRIDKACNWNRISTNGDSQDELVRMMKLDEFIETKVDFVRMDVEGYEYNILLGMDRILRQDRPQMFIEVHRDLLKDYGYSQLQFMEMLADYDYSISKSYISARESVSGKIKDLLSDSYSRKMITERGIASHMFFKG